MGHGKAVINNILGATKLSELSDVNIDSGTLNDSQFLFYETVNPNPRDLFWKQLFKWGVMKDSKRSWRPYRIQIIWHKNVFFLSCNFMSILRDVGKGFNKRTSSGGVAFQPLHLLMQLQKKEKLWNKNDIFYSIIIISGTHNQAQAHDHNEEHQDEKPTPSWWSSSFL